MFIELWNIVAQVIKDNKKIIYKIFSVDFCTSWYD